MIKVDFKDYSDYIPYAQQCKCGNVYLLSIAEGYQQGNVIKLRKRKKVTGTVKVSVTFIMSNFMNRM